MTLDPVAFVPSAQQSGDFSPTPPANRAGQGPVGPSSNTGQNPSDSLARPIVDFCTVVIPAGALKKTRCRDYRELLEHIFSTGSDVAMGPILDRTWQFYPQSATLVDSTGSVCGKVGFAEDGKICVSLTGQGCQHVRSWHHARCVLEDLDAKLTRVDIAVDDLRGDHFDVSTFKQYYEDGEFTSNGRPPTSQFVDDMGSGKGCTLYVGQKGHKQLCIYEKGKQLGDPRSAHTRCELRLYARRLDLPLDALTRLDHYFAGAYPLLAQYVAGEAEKLLVKEQVVSASASAMLRFVRNQCGTALGLVLDALGDDNAEEILAFLNDRIARPGRPGRFKKFSGDLPTYIRNELTRENDNGQDQDQERS